MVFLAQRGKRVSSAKTLCPLISSVPHFEMRTERAADAGLYRLPLETQPGKDWFVQYASVRRCEFVTPAGGVNRASGIVDYSFVPEILLQFLVVGEQKTRAADLRQGEHVGIVGYETASPLKARFSATDLMPGTSVHPAHIQGDIRPDSEVFRCIEFLP